MKLLNGEKWAQYTSQLCIIKFGDKKEVEAKGDRGIMCLLHFRGEWSNTRLLLNLSWYPSFHSRTIGRRLTSPSGLRFLFSMIRKRRMGYHWRQLLSFLWYFILMHSFIWKWIKQVFCPRIFSYVVFKLCVFFCLVSTLDYLYWVILDPVITHVREPGRAGNLKKMWKIFCRTPGFLRKKRIEGPHEIQFRYQ